MTTPLDDHEAPAFYQAVLKAFEDLPQQPSGVETKFLGMAAWHSLTREQQADQLPVVLGAYVQLVHDEEHEMQAEEAAADSTRTYVRVEDIATLWDSVDDRQNQFGEVPAHRQALLNVLCELELLQHRLAMTKDELPGGAS